jgi:hypothetical protein
MSTVTVEHLSKRLEDFVAVDDGSFEVDKVGVSVTLYNRSAEPA